VKSLIFVMHSIACMDIFVQLNIELKCQWNYVHFCLYCLQVQS